MVEVADVKERCAEMPSILAFGHPLIDVHANVKKEFFKKYELEENGAILSGPRQKGLHEDLSRNYDLKFSCGGSAQNTLRMIQWLLDDKSIQCCYYLGCAGNDKSAELLLEEMEAVGVQAVYQVSESQPTGVSFVLIHGTNRSLVTSLGAAGSFSIEFLRKNLAWSMVEASAVFYILGYFLVSNTDCVMAVVDHVVKTDKTICFSLSAPYVSKQFIEKVNYLLPYANFVFAAGDELIAFAEAHNLKDKSIAATATYMAGFHRARKSRHRLVVVTQGPGEILVISSTDMVLQTFPVNPLPPEEIVDTNGAGDAFTAGFLTSFLTTGSIESAVKVGEKAAQYIIKKSGFTLGDRSHY